MDLRIHLHTFDSQSFRLTNGSQEARYRFYNLTGIYRAVYHDSSAGETVIRDSGYVCTKYDFQNLSQRFLLSHTYKVKVTGMAETKKYSRRQECSLFQPKNDVTAIALNCLIVKFSTD
jgi:hypothetical protein